MTRFDCASDIFVVPVLDRYLLHAPLHGLSAVVDATAMSEISRYVRSGDVPHPAMAPIAQALADGERARPERRTGAVREPLLLGLIPTRGCNMACRYCDFEAPKLTSRAMSQETVKDAIDAYFGLLVEHGGSGAMVHFFGGEPFAAPDTVRFAVAYARERSEALGIPLHLEATSNGLFSQRFAQWVADTFDAVVLSLDGTRDVFDAHRPGLGGRSVFDVVVRAARVLAAGPVELIPRSCVTSATVKRLPEIAEWLWETLRPRLVCFETLTAPALAGKQGLFPPDPFEFAEQFDAAAQVLRSHGATAVLSTADTSINRLSFCPVGHDALIVDADGAVNACYRLPDDWKVHGLDMRLGQVDRLRGGFLLDGEAVERVRALDVDAKPACAHCFCRYHCAGGCHVNHVLEPKAGAYDDLCLQTRVLTVVRLLRDLRQDALADAWLRDGDAKRSVAWQKEDLLEMWGTN